MAFCVNAQSVTKISSNIKMSIVDNCVSVTISDNNYDKVDNIYTIRFGKIDNALATLSKMEYDLLNGNEFATVLYTVIDNQLKALLGVDTSGKKYILINADHQYEMHMPHIKKIKKVINKYTTNEQ